MWPFINYLLFGLCLVVMYGNTSCKEQEPALYYYGSESERNLPACEEKQACSVLLLRYWQDPALVRLCRCAARMRCDAIAPSNSLIELNNRAYFQFCKPITDWPECSNIDSPLIVETSYDRINPDEIEELHHRNIELTPPKIIFNCRCRNPNYWRPKSNTDDNDAIHVYRCSFLPLCETGEFCGNVNYDLNALYQSCLCPKNHICVHNGGVTYDYISELLYRGRGWKAYCQSIKNNTSTEYEDY
ncbi:uncharacterized protein LOC113521320 [Galleria mellonella]|uniref:Uncharacterized protein LOC113521320 n=1 Tax=Galleria mellonella TaxID=7137 RepID=A0A6J1X7E5_GALME|nr:uncharacterized protein LOC113521320 [Galleria mellonella]